MKKMKKALATVLAMMIILATFTTTAFAANVCSQIDGNSRRSRTFTVDTGKRFILKDKIKLKQTKGVFRYDNWVGKSKTAKGYDKFSVKVEKIEGSSGVGKVKYYTLKGKSLTIKLDKYSTYRITVTPASTSDLTARYWLKGCFDYWEKPASWKISTTKGIIACG
jgi:hypothetical protein